MTDVTQSEYDAAENAYEKASERWTAVHTTSPDGTPLALVFRIPDVSGVDGTLTYYSVLASTAQNVMRRECVREAVRAAIVVRDKLAATRKPILTPAPELVREPVTTVDK